MHSIANPEELETPPEEVKFDKDVEYHVPKVKTAGLTPGFFTEFGILGRGTMGRGEFK